MYHQKLSILLWLNRSKIKNDKSIPIYARITIEGDRDEISTGKLVKEEDWDNESKQVRKTDPNYREVNSKLLQIKAVLDRHFTILQAQHEFISPLMLKNVYNNLPLHHPKGQPRPKFKETPTLLMAADQVIANFEKMVEKKLRSPQSLRQWRSTRNKIADFIKSEYRMTDLKLENIQSSFATKFYNYLTIEREKVLQEASAKKQVKNTKTILNYAQDENWITNNPIERFRCGGDETEILPLEIYEVDTIWRKNISIPRLHEVRDAFVFQCFTGLAYQDIFALSPDHIIRVGVTNERWLVKERGKTKVTEMVPILPIVEELIEKYKNHPYCLQHNKIIPINSNYRYNVYLKELADICGIGRSLNTHLARHTFADIMLNIFGFSLEEVSKMLGHRSIRTTQRYVKVRKIKISQKLNTVKSILFMEDGQLRKIAD